MFFFYQGIVELFQHRQAHRDELSWLGNQVPTPALSRLDRWLTRLGDGLISLGLKLKKASRTAERFDHTPHYT